MLSSWRFYVGLLVAGLLGTVGLLALTVPGAPVGLAGEPATAASPGSISAALGVPGVQLLDGDQQEQDQLVADRANPMAVEGRLLSRTRYEHLGSQAAVRVIGQTVPFVARRSLSGIGRVPAGAHVASYLGAGMARLDLPGGGHALAESMTPMATRSPSGRYVPVDLALHESGHGFVADNTATPVSIPKSLQSGVKLDAGSVSLTPLNASGAPLAVRGRLDGGAVVYPNTATDADTAAKPTPTGFEDYDTLRSVASPQELSYRVGMPAGASLRRTGHGSSTISVVADGRTLASIPPASAVDAEGADVPVSMSLSGDTLKLTVDHRAGDYRYPIAVDPNVADGNLTGRNENWRFVNGGGGKKGLITGRELSGSWELEVSPWVTTNEWGALVYPTQGESRIYYLYMETSSSTGNAIENHLAIAGPPPHQNEFEKAVWEGSAALSKSYGRGPTSVCVPGCEPPDGSASNVAMYWLNAIKEGAGFEGGGTVDVYAGAAYIAQNNGPTISIDTTKEHDEFEKDRNTFYGSGAWMSKNNYNVAMFNETDPGVGVGAVEYKVAGKKWTESPVCEYGVQCPESEASHISEVSGGGMPDGEPTIEAKALNAMGMSSATVTGKLKVDSTAPHEITLSGLPGGNEINDATRSVKLVAHATDGTTGTPSSGVASIALSMDGSAVGSANGSCSPGPCTATGEWTLNAEELPAGKHTLTVTATDAAGNAASSEIIVTVHHASTTAVGPGQLNPVTGDFDLEETDASIATTGSPLTVTRNYSSREPGAGAEGSLGAPWSLSFGGAQKLIQVRTTRNYGMTLVAGDGSQAFFREEGGGKYESPAGDRSLVLTVNGAGTEYTLTDKGTSTVFTHVSGDNPAVWRPALATGTAGTHATQYTYQVVGGVTEPLQELGPVPAGVSCTPSLKPGCRALTFNYATSTTATGEKSSEWGDYNGRLTRVYFATAEEKEGKIVEVTKTIAQYAYDSKGRMRAVWDPAISPALKTTYGYDSEGHVVAITPPGQVTWAFIYGTTAQDATPGRLIQVAHPSAAVWNGNQLANTTTPALSGSALVGGEMGAGRGHWSNGAVAYGFQWEQCNGAGAECKVIAGATSSSYVPVAGDAGHTLVARVTAINGGGTAVAYTSLSAVVASSPSGGSSVTQSISSSELRAVACVPEYSWCAASDVKGNLYYATNVSGTSPATWKSWTGPGTSPGDALSCPTTSLCLVASGEKGGSGGTLYYGAMGGSLTQVYNPSNGVDAISCVWTSFCLAGQDKYGDFGYSTNPESSSWSPEEIGTSGRAIKGVSCQSSSFCASVDGTGDLHVATSTAQAESSTWTETDIDGTSALNGVACTSTVSCIAVDGAGNVLDLALSESGTATVAKQNIDGTNSLTAIACGEVSCAAVDNHGNVFVSVNEGATWVEGFQFGDDLTSVSCYIICVAGDTTGHVVAFEPSSVVETSNGAPAVDSTTIEYGLPVTGSRAPYALGSSEVAKWSQTDVPAEGTAIFPEWKRAWWPQPGTTWPAPSYKGATVDYLDAADRVVNVAAPTGGIATNEYNSYGDVVRTLSADDRETALKEGSKSAEVAQTLDTQSTYGSEGTELLSTLGPLHTVKLASGATAKARKHTVYSYDEGAPSEGGPYKLVTKVTEGAQITGEPEADVRTTTDSYNGQNGLGWILRKPTATRVDPSGLDLVHAAVYDPSTGNVTETRTPGAAPPGEELASYVYKSSFGSWGTGNGQMTYPMGITQDSEGNLYVADEGNNRIDEFSSSGTFIKKFGGTGSSEGELKEPQGITIDTHGTIWVANYGKNRISAFNKEGKYLRSIGLALKSPGAVAYSPSNGRLYITDGEDNRVEWINPEHEYEYGFFGSFGKGNGQFDWPEGVTTDSAGNVWVSDGNPRVEEFSAAGVYMSQIDLSGEGEYPNALAFDSAGDLLVDVAGGFKSHVDVFSPSGAYKSQFGGSGTEEERLQSSNGMVLDSSGDAFLANWKNGKVEEWAPAGHESHGTGGTHGMQTIYYTAASNSEVPACGSQPAWAGMPCEKRPAAQPETSGVPNLPVTTVTYNIWDEPLVSTETVGASTRTDTNVYDEAGRTQKETISSATGTALPSVEYAYNSETGAMAKSSTTSEGVTREIRPTYDRFGEMTSYADASGHTSKFTYTYGRLEKSQDEAGEQSYHYTSSGLLGEIQDSAAGTFGGSYDVEGNLTAETYPNGMTANRTFDATGREMGIEYVKTTHCTSGCVWYSQSESPSIHDQTLSQTSTLSSQTYAYDAAGRLTTAQDTPVGEGCTTRIYGYEQETNITSLTTRAPGTGGKCATEGGSAVNHTYDGANRLTDTGIEYNTFGDITKLPAGDAGGSALTSTFYTDGTLASQTQNGETIGYNLDPAGRDREIVSTGTTSSTVTYAYDEGSDAPAWTEDTAGKITRNIYGFEGALVATKSGTESPVLQIQDLHSNLVGTASLSETATGLLSKGDSTEYGVPRTSSPPKYSWQGAFALRTELPSGVIAMGARSYVPQIARFLQPDPVEGGSANEYAYTYGDPIDSADPSGEYTVATPGWLSGFLDEEAEAATEAAIQRAAEEQAARREAEEKAGEAAEAAFEESLGGGGGKGKKGKAGKSSGRVNPNIAMYHDGNGSTAGPKYKKQGKKIEPNKHCEPGEVQPEKGKYCEKGPEKGQRPDPPVAPPPSIIGEAKEDAEGVIDDCIEIGICE